jgi:hypothetical protein
MKCKKIQRWLSDSLDGEMPKGIKTEVDAHLGSCSSCRAFLDQISRIDVEARGLDSLDMSPTPTGEFTARLKSAISDLEEKSQGGILHVFRRKWIFVPASVFLVSLFILIFVFYERGDFREEDVYVFSLGKVMEEIYREMGSDLVLQDAFHSLLAASIDEMLLSADTDEGLYWGDDLSLWEEFSDEDMDILAPEIKKNNDS